MRKVFAVLVVVGIMSVAAVAGATPRGGVDPIKPTAVSGPITVE